MATAKATAKPKNSFTAGGKRFNKVSCSSTKSQAKGAADNIRKKGGTARVVKQGSAFCVFKGPRAKRRGRYKAA